MKSPWWPALVVAWLGLTFPGVTAPATFFIKHVSADEKDDFPPLSPPPPPISSFSFTSGTTPFPVQKTHQNDFQSRIYPGTTYNEDFGTYPDNSLSTGFEFTGFNLPPGEISPTAAEKSREDYGPTGYNVESGEPPDYQTFYSSDEEERPPPPPRSQPSEEEHRDYNDEDDSTPQNYEVEEKIPDDLKYKPPKVTVYPLPPPCKGATPPPWPTNPPPPKPPPKKPKPKPKPGGGGSGYYTYAAYPGQRTATRASAKYRPTASARYRAAKAKPRLVYQQAPYVIRYSGVGNRPILIRHRTVRPMTVSHPTRVYRASKKPPAKPKEIIKEVHIHHHHNPPLPPLPHPIPIVPLIPLLDENGFPLHRSDAQGRNPYGAGVPMTSSGSDNLANFAPFGLTPSGSDNVGLIAVAPSPPTGTDNLATVGRFAEPPPHTTSSYRETEAANTSAIVSQSAVEITG